MKRKQHSFVSPSDPLKDALNWLEESLRADERPLEICDSLRKAIQKRDLLHDFAFVVLEILQMDREWNADTIDRIGHEAIELGLGKTSPDGFFVSNSTFQPSNT